MKFKKVTHQFYPIDHFLFSKKFLNYWKPNVAIFLESEIWPSMFKSLKKKKIPLILLNARITNKTFKYLKNGELKIKQDIIINNDRYKKILLGRKGSKIKDIRIKSQKEISNILDVKTHLYINIISSNAKKRLVLIHFLEVLIE